MNDESKNTDLNSEEYRRSRDNHVMLGPAKDADHPGTSAEQKKVESELQALKDGQNNATIVWEDLEQDKWCLLDMTGVCEETPDASQSLHSQNTDTVLILK